MHDIYMIKFGAEIPTDHLPGTYALLQARNKVKSYRFSHFAFTFGQRLPSYLVLITLGHKVSGAMAGLSDVMFVHLRC